MSWSAWTGQQGAGGPGGRAERVRPPRRCRPSTTLAHMLRTRSGRRVRRPWPAGYTSARPSAPMSASPASPSRWVSLRPMKRSAPSAQVGGVEDLAEPIPCRVGWIADPRHGVRLVGDDPPSWFHQAHHLGDDLFG